MLHVLTSYDKQCYLTWKMLRLQHGTPDTVHLYDSAVIAMNQCSPAHATLPVS